MNEETEDRDRDQLGPDRRDGADLRDQQEGGELPPWEGAYVLFPEHRETELMGHIGPDGQNVYVTAYRLNQQKEFDTNLDKEEIEALRYNLELGGDNGD